MTQEQFEQTWHFKIVRPKLQHYKLPDKEYIVSSALYNHDEEKGEKITTFAIKAVDYSLENKHWITIKIGESEFEKCMADFEIIGDGRERYVRPVIHNEFFYCLLAEDADSLYSQAYPIADAEKGELGEVQLMKHEKRAIPNPSPVGQVSWQVVYRDFFSPEGVAAYKVPIPDELVNDIPAALEYIKPFRQDVLDMNVIMGKNMRILKGNLLAQNP